MDLRVIRDKVQAARDALTSGARTVGTYQEQAANLAKYLAGEVQSMKDQERFLTDLLTAINADLAAGKDVRAAPAPPFGGARRIGL